MKTSFIVMVIIIGNDIVIQPNLNFNTNYHEKK